MELNSNDSDTNPQSSRSKPFDIDLNETPLPSPRETPVAGAAVDVSSAPVLASNSCEGSRIDGGGVGLLDINALPPCEEESNEFVSSGSNNAPAACSNLLYVGRQLDRLKAPGSIAGFVRSGFEDIVQPRPVFGRNLRESDQSPVHRERVWASDNSIPGTSYQNYYALNGNRFDSMFDVPCHLGLVSNYRSVESQDRSDGFTLVQKGLHLNQRRKESLISSQVKNFRECQENLKGNFGGEFSLGIQTAEIQIPACNLSNFGVTQANLEENVGCDSLKVSVGLPVEFEDFCLLAVGEVDPRPSYHNSSQIWPVGYKSSWHDKVTGSLFVCDVSDGGDFGPLFKVKRYPCSAKCIPTGSTIFLRPSLEPHDGKSLEGIEGIVGLHDDENTNIQMILSDDSPPHLGNDNWSDFGIDLEQACKSQTTNETKSDCLSKIAGRPTSDYIVLDDDIGEFLVEGRSSTSVWRMVSQTLVHACRKIYEQTGVCKFCCKHDVFKIWSSCFVSVSEEATESSDSLSKFCCLSGPVNIPHHIRSNNELETSCKALVKWLDQDRFGLDVEFVQEIVEQLPRVRVCAEYTFLDKRRDWSTSQTVRSGFLRVKRKSNTHEKAADCHVFKGCQRIREQVLENPVMKPYFLPGKPLSSKLPIELVGDVIQSWELLWRFSEVLGLEEPLSFKELEEELRNGSAFSLRSSSTAAVTQEIGQAFIAEETESLREAAHVRLASNANSSHTNVGLANVLCSLLILLLGELQSKVAVLVDTNFDGTESKSRRRRKKDAENLMSAKKIMLDLLPVNILTWPELARRYLLTVSSMEGNLDTVDFLNHESCKALNCFQGDSGTIHSSRPGVAGMEADALLLAEATKRIFGSLKSTSGLSSVHYNDFDAVGAHETVKVNNSGIPGWAQVLEPVRKLPTNVGARIRKCIYDALDKDPPEWARKRLEHSISKEVYKGNASGPTKKAVLSVLADVCGENQPQKLTRKRKNRCFSSVPDVIMKQCRKVLRCAAAADEEKVFCNLLGRTLLNTSDNDDEGLLGFPAMVSRPLDFRTIDLRLAFGAYGGSHEAFLEDVREVWHHIRTAYSDQSDLLQLAGKLCQNFEVLYEKEVLTLVQKFTDYPSLECLNSEAKKEMEDILESASEIPKAPWDEGVCKVCGIDKDDDNVLLCDTCDSGYHTYCLTPPLTRVPEGNWYCPPCLTGNCKNMYTSQVPHISSRSQKRRHQGEFTCRILDEVTHLAATMEMRDYWDYSDKERIFLLKFLCDELLNSTNIREHLECCASVSVDLQQKIRSLSLEWRNLKFREEILAGKVARDKGSVLSGTGKCGTEGVATLYPHYGKLTRQPPGGNGYLSSSTNDLVHSKDGLQLNESRKLSCWFYSKGISMRQPSCSRNQIGKAPYTEFQVHQQSEKDNIRVVDLQYDLPHSASQPQKQDSAGEYASWRNKGQDLENGRTSGPLQPSCEASQSHFSSDHTNRNQVAEHLSVMPMNPENIVPGHHSIVQHDMNEPHAHDLKGSLVKNEIAVLQDSIACLESQQLTVSLRKELLGRDSTGRLYWAFFRPNTSPWLLVDGTTVLEQERILKEHGDLLANSPFEAKYNGIPTSSSWFSYQCDSEIEELIQWLSDSDPRDKELAESILRWTKIGYKDLKNAGNHIEDESLNESVPSSSKRRKSEATVNSSGLVTKALIVLEKKHGPCLDPEAFKMLMKLDTNSELTCKERMYRCECLEPVLPNRFHCHNCHLSFSARNELEEHNDGKCNLSATSSQKSKADDEGTKGAGMIRTETLQAECMETAGKGMSWSLKHGTAMGSFEIPKEFACPFNFEEISTKFVTKNSIKELVQEIGLIGSNGVPAFVPSTSPYLCDPSLKLVEMCKNEINQGNKSTNSENLFQYSVAGNMVTSLKHDNISNNSSRRCSVSHNDEEVLKCRRLNPIFMSEKRDQSFNLRSLKPGVGNSSIALDTSLRPLLGKGIEILRQLKINLLDMDAAVPEEALRSSKACWEKRSAWRAFVKSAKSIFEMVQATIVLEDMIKTDYLRNGWWYWSSLSGAANIATVSALALRLYTLDAAIVYEKHSDSIGIQEHIRQPDKETSPCKDSKSNPKPSKAILKTQSSDLTDFSKTRSKTGKKRKD